METNLITRLQATLLAVATAVLFVLAILNLRQENSFQQPDDGVWWSEAQGGNGLEAVKVLPNSPGQHAGAGIQEHDLLTAAQVAPENSAQHGGEPAQNLLDETPVTAETPAPHRVEQPQNLLNGVGVKAPSEHAGQHSAVHAKNLLAQTSYSKIEHVADLERVLYRTEIYGKANYQIARNGVALDVQVIPEPAYRGMTVGLRAIGLIYLAIGIYVLFRRWTAPRATHFYLFCLVSFALYALKYTAKFDTLDWVVFWTNVLAESLQPALFLHFALSFPEERLKNIRRRWLLPLIYAPGAGLLGLWVWTIQTREATGLHAAPASTRPPPPTTRSSICWPPASSCAGYSQADTPLQRQQLSGSRAARCWPFCPSRCSMPFPSSANGICPAC